MKKSNVLFMLLMGLTVLSTNISCKKDRSSEPEPAEWVLSKVYSNGTLEFTYSYNDAKQLVEIGSYNIYTGEPNQFVKLEYDEHGLLRKTSVNSEGTATLQTVYERGSNGELVGEETTALAGADAGKVKERKTYTYGEGRVSKVVGLDPDTGDEVGYMEIEYFPDGTMERSIRYVFDSAQRPHAWTEDHFVGNNRQIPENVAKYQGNPLIHPYAPFFVAKEFNSIVYDKTTSLVQSEQLVHLKNREYDEAGFLIKQIMTVEFVKPTKPNDERVVTYVYAEL